MRRHEDAERRQRLGAEDLGEVLVLGEMPVRPAGDREQEESA